MKRVFRIQGQGKVKDVGLRGLSTVPAAESVDAKSRQSKPSSLWGSRRSRRP